MTIHSTTPPTNPYHIARAYGVQAGGGIGAIKPVQRAVTTPVQPVAPVARDAGAGALRDSNLQRIVAGVVPGGVSFDASGAGQPTGGALPLYRHPADKNAAATAVSVGRSLDVRG
jgi:hypothetical protein